MLWIISQQGELHKILGIFKTCSNGGINIYGYNENKQEILLGFYMNTWKNYEIVDEIKSLLLNNQNVVYEMPKSDKTIRENGKKVYVRETDYDRYKDWKNNNRKQE